jgi:CBS domain-containing protein
MTADPVTLLENAPLRTGALLLYHYEIGGAPVMAADGTLVGVLSEHDLLDKEALPHDALAPGARQARRRQRAKTVGEACTRPAKITRPEVSLHAATREMADQDISRLVVVDGARVVGILTRHDVLGVFTRNDEVLESAVSTVLDEQGWGSMLEVSVEWGVVQLTGTMQLRSDIDDLTARVAAIDGVITVDADGVRYDLDDTIPVTWP